MIYGYGTAPYGTTVVQVGGATFKFFNVPQAIPQQLMPAAQAITAATLPIAVPAVIGATANAVAAASNFTTAATLLQNRSATYVGTILADNPDLYWRLDEASGTFAADFSGHGNSGVYAGSSLTLNQSGALTASGDNDASINLNGNGWVSSSYPFAVGGQQSYEGWAKGSGTALLFSADVHTGSEPYMYFGGGSVPQWYPRNANYVNYSPYAWPASTWNHWVLTWDDAAMVAHFYVNGVEITGSWVGSPQNYTNPHNFEAGSTGAGVICFPGQLDDYAAYPYILTPAQVLAHYNAGMAPGTARVVAQTVTQAAVTVSAAVQLAASAQTTSAASAFVSASTRSAAAASAVTSASTWLAVGVQIALTAQAATYTSVLTTAAVRPSGSAQGTSAAQAATTAAVLLPSLGAGVTAATVALTSGKVVLTPTAGTTTAASGSTTAPLSLVLSASAATQSSVAMFTAPQLQMTAGAVTQALGPTTASLRLTPVAGAITATTNVVTASTVPMLALTAQAVTSASLTIVVTQWLTVTAQTSTRAVAIFSGSIVAIPGIATAAQLTITTPMLLTVAANGVSAASVNVAANVLFTASAQTSTAALAASAAAAQISAAAQGTSATALVLTAASNLTAAAGASTQAVMSLQVATLLTPVVSSVSQATAAIQSVFVQAVIPVAGATTQSLAFASASTTTTGNALVVGQALMAVTAPVVLGPTAGTATTAMLLLSVGQLMTATAQGTSMAVAIATAALAVSPDPAGAGSSAICSLTVAGVLTPAAGATTEATIALSVLAVLTPTAGAISEADASLSVGRALSLTAECVTQANCTAFAIQVPMLTPWSQTRTEVAIFFYSGAPPIEAPTVAFVQTRGSSALLTGKDSTLEVESSHTSALVFGAQQTHAALVTYGASLSVVEPVRTQVAVGDNTTQAVLTNRTTMLRIMPLKTTQLAVIDHETGHDMQAGDQPTLIIMGV